MIQSRYEDLCRTPSDINEHLPTLARYASECRHVTECGVRTAVSSYAFGYALATIPGSKLVQVDLDSHPELVQFQSRAKDEGLHTVFHQQSDLVCPIEETDLLFIDTWHIYGHLKRELARWHPHVRKYILLHDTTVDEWHGETIRNGWDAVRQSRETGIPVEEIRKGLWPAVTEFLVEHPEWRIRERFVHNNGLTVLYKTA
jgi:hypothetical protein